MASTYRYYSNNNILYQFTCDDDSFNSVVFVHGENKIIGTTSTYQGSCNDSCIDRYNNIPELNRVFRKDNDYAYQNEILIVLHLLLIIDNNYMMPNKTRDNPVNLII